MTSTPSAMPPLGRPLPVPPDFPVKWADPSQAGQLWMLDRMHFGGPVLPLVADVYRCQVASGFNRTAERLQFPVRIAFLSLNGYLYNSNPNIDLPPELVQKALSRLGQVAPSLFNKVQDQVVKGMTAKYMAHVEPLMATLEAQWEKNWRPEIQEHLAFLREFDLAAASPQALLTHLEESLKRTERLWELHFEILVPSVIALSQFVDEYHDVLESQDNRVADSFTIYALLQGVNHSYLQADQALWQLSHQARTMPVVRKTLQDHPASEVIPLLANQVEGEIFLAELCVWLESYGHQGYGGDGLGETSWLEDPAPVIQNLQANLALPDQDFLAEIEAQAVERSQRIDQARQRLQSKPAPTGPRTTDQALIDFDRRLKAAQCGEFLLTEHNFWIDQMAMVRLRLVFLEVGRRYVDKTLLDQASDIFYLTLDEIVAGAQAGTTPYQGLVDERKRHFADAHTLKAPDAVGTMPWLAPPDEPFVRAMSRLFGRPLVPTLVTQSDSSSIVRGQAASAGKVRGHARVIHTLDDAARLQQGDILVTMATMPPWTPLLAIAGAVVTDAGGILSHAAILAREYGIPAVVSTRIGTQVIQEGQLLEVDGSAGIVHILAG